MTLTDIVKKFGIGESIVQPFGTGLINHTWQVLQAGLHQKYILQKINTGIFKSPGAIAFNTRLMADHLKRFHPEYFFISAVTTITGEDMLHTQEGVFRMFPFVPDSHTIDTVQNPQQAYEAARAFGKFTKVLAGMEPSQLKITLPHFHDLDMRFQKFEEAVQHGNQSRFRKAKKLVDFIYEHRDIADEYHRIQKNKEFRVRATHHDTKISNVLFNPGDHCLCVIDLDTVMPGYFISDVGDMIRTYVSAAGEEEKDFSRMIIRNDFLDAILEGYSAEMENELTTTEKNHFLYAGKFMIYMQAIRFITDHVNDDIYYGAKYENHNFMRAGNQAELLRQLVKI
ncbi:MAG: aminoglycoside phosphotransferase family protein [Ginsengibacter sp.]